MASSDDVSTVELPAPPHWKKMKVVAKKGGTPRKNVIIFTAPTGEEISSKRKLEQYLKSHPGGPQVSEFDWGTGETPRRSTRISEKPRAAPPPESEPPKKRGKKSSASKTEMKDKEISEETEPITEVDKQEPEKSHKDSEALKTAKDGKKEKQDGEKQENQLLPDTVQENQVPLDTVQENQVPPGTVRENQVPPDTVQEIQVPPDTVQENQVKHEDEKHAEDKTQGTTPEDIDQHEKNIDSGRGDSKEAQLEGEATGTENITGKEENREVGVQDKQVTGEHQNHEGAVADEPNATAVNISIENPNDLVNAGISEKSRNENGSNDNIDELKL